LSSFSSPQLLQSARISICICTFQRTNDLRRLLVSLEKLQGPSECEIEVVVADNDPAASAQTLIEDLALNYRWPLQYKLEPNSGVSYARNCAARAASGDWIAFVDDDEWVEPGWLWSFVAQLRVGNCEALFGPVIPDFEIDPPAWARPLSVFQRPRRANGTRLDWRSCGAGNVLMKRELFHRVGGFDPDFARSGGEDSEFFSRCEQAGARLVWCDEAIAHETVPAARLRKAWVRERSLRGGRSYARIVALRRGLPGAVDTAIRGLFGLLGHTVLAVLAYLTGRPSAFQRECRAWQALGKCTPFVGRASGPYGQGKPKA
jgi:succinoglycan biosynthesis protein ExoM